MTVKILKKGVKIDGEYFPCHYSSSKNNINGNATIYMKSYKRLPDEAYNLLQVENNTDLMTDYSERDRIRIRPDSQYFNIVNLLG